MGAGLRLRPSRIHAPDGHTLRATGALVRHQLIRPRQEAPQAPRRRAAPHHRRAAATVVRRYSAGGRTEAARDDVCTMQKALTHWTARACEGRSPIAVVAGCATVCDSAQSAVVYCSSNPCARRSVERATVMNTVRRSCFMPTSAARALEQEVSDRRLSPGRPILQSERNLLVVAGVRCCGQEHHSAAALRDGIHRRASRAPDGRRVRLVDDQQIPSAVLQRPEDLRPADEFERANVDAGKAPRAHVVRQLAGGPGE